MQGADGERLGLAVAPLVRLGAGGDGVGPRAPFARWFAGGGADADGYRVVADQADPGTFQARQDNGTELRFCTDGDGLNRFKKASTSATSGGSTTQRPTATSSPKQI